MVPRLLLRSESNTARCLAVLFCEGLRLPRALAVRWVAAVMESRYSRPRELRAYLAVHQRHPALRASTVLRHQCTPTFLLSLLEDLVHEGLLTRQECTAIEEHLLARMTSAGEWTLLARKDVSHAL